MFSKGSDFTDVPAVYAQYCEIVSNLIDTPKLSGRQLSRVICELMSKGEDFIKQAVFNVADYTKPI